MCHGDVGLVTYSWNPDSSKPAANGTAHECVDWDRLAEWSKKRAVDMFKPGFLVHPKLGMILSGSALSLESDSPVTTMTRVSYKC
jgi:hypothetical protein